MTVDYIIKKTLKNQPFTFLKNKLISNGLNINIKFLFQLHRKVLPFF